MNFQASEKANTYEAIVIGSGISGGWAAKELGDKGVKTLVLERGRNVEHLKDYPTTNMKPWEFEHRGQMPEDVVKANPVVSKCYAFREDAAHFFVKRQRSSLCSGKAFRLDSRISGGRKIITLGPPDSALERLRFHGSCTRWFRRRLAHPI